LDSLKEIFERRVEKGPLSFIKFPDDTVVSFCSLSLNEFKIISLMRDRFSLSNKDIFDILYEHCVPEEDKPISLDNMEAGISEVVGLAIWNQSNPLMDLAEKLEAKRNSYDDDIIDTITTHIIAAFPAYKIDELERLPIDSILSLLVKAEKCLAIKNPEYKRIEFANKGETKRASIDFDKENKIIRG